MATVQAQTDLVDAYRSMSLIRRFEDACLDLRRADVIAGSIHLSTGQEAIPVGALAALEDADRVVGTYRGHGWALACGVPAVDLLAEVCQRATGINGGRAGSAYLLAPQHGFLGENSIVGAGVPIAAGAALAAQTQGGGRVVVVSVGDGATSQGALHEGLVFAAARSLPLVLVCENNGWSEMTPISRVTRLERLSARAAGYGIPGLTVDGNDPQAVRDAVADAARRARDGDGPTFVECVCHRLGAHYNGDIEHYRPKDDKQRAVEADPLPRARQRLLEAGHIDEATLVAVELAVEEEIAAAVAAVREAQPPAPGDAGGGVVGPPARARSSAAPAQAREMTYLQAVNAALHAELDERPETLLFGEDVGHAGGIFGATRQLQEAFGEQRVFDMPIAESAILGSAVGAAIEGQRPIVEIMWADFMLVALDQLINQAANLRYVSGGAVHVPIVVRTQQGVTPGSCAQHSQSLEALLAHIPGLRVGLPATPQDAYSMLRAAVADDDPVVLFESRGLYQQKGPVQTGGEVEGLGGARIRRQGDAATIITWGSLLPTVMAATDQLGAEGIETTVLDLRWLAPLDEAAIRAATGQSGRVLVAHEANRTGGFGAEVAARIGEHDFDRLDAPVMRLGSPDVRFPSAPSLQRALVPDAGDVVRAVRALLD